MCDPLSITSAALAAGAMVANKVGGDQQQAARQQVVQQNQQRQFELQDKSNQVFNNTMAKVTPTQTADNVKKEAATQTANDSALIDSNAGNVKQATGDAPQEVGNSTSRAISDALARGKTQAKLNASTGAVRRVGLQNDIAIGQGGQQQGQIGGAMTRQAGLMPAELADADRSGSGWRQAGQIMQLGSTATGLAGLTGAGPSFGDLFGGGAGADVTPSLYGVSSPEMTQTAYAGAKGAQPGLFPRIGNWMGFK